MVVRPVDQQDVPLIHEWLSVRDNIKWLEFTEMSLLKVKFLLSKSTDVYWVFAPDRSHPPIGIVAVVDIHPVHRTAGHWAILGDKRYSGKGYSSQAASEILQYAFSELKLHSINTYVVESNVNPLVRSSGFTYYGRQRQCHFVDGVFRDRLRYDLLSSEFKPLQYHEVELLISNSNMQPASR